MSKLDMTEFIRSTFRSVWTLELLLLMAEDREKLWSESDLIASLRASEVIVARGIEDLVAAGLISIEADRCARYGPASRELDLLVVRTRDFYATSPDQVRRTIVRAGSGGIAAFADAFRIRKD